MDPDNPFPRHPSTPLSPGTERRYALALLTLIRKVERREHLKQVMGWSQEDPCPACGVPTDHLDLTRGTAEPTPRPCGCELDPEQSDRLLAWIPNPDLAVLHTCVLHKSLVDRYLSWLATSPDTARDPQWVAGHLDALWGVVHSVAVLYIGEFGDA